MAACRRSGAVVVAVCLAWTMPADAQTGARGRVVAESAIIWRTDSTLPLATVPSGELLTVTGQSQRWYEVRVPEQLAGPNAVGLIARTQLQLEPGSAPPPMKVLRGDPPPGPPTPPPGATTRAPAKSPTRAPKRFPTGYLTVDFATQTHVEDVEETVTLRVNEEDGQIHTLLNSGQAWGVSVHGAKRVAGPLAIGGGGEAFTRSTSGSFTAAIPHPFFFGTPRTVTEDLDGLQRTQVGLHFHVGGLWFPGKRMHVSVRGGPSVFYVKQAIVTDVHYSESYPYDVVTFKDAVTREVDGWRFGFNAGGDVAYYIGRKTGVGGNVSYARGDVALGSDAAEASVVRGVTISAGLRFKF
jgi:hypothetical protein